MKELKCPNCGKVFSVDESEYATIVNQVRTAEFEEDLHRSLIFKSNLAAKKQS